MPHNFTRSTGKNIHIPGGGRLNALLNAPCNYLATGLGGAVSWFPDASHASEEFCSCRLTWRVVLLKTRIWHSEYAPDMVS